MDLETLEEQANAPSRVIWRLAGEIRAMAGAGDAPSGELASLLACIESLAQEAQSTATVIVWCLGVTVTRSAVEDCAGSAVRLAGQSTVALGEILEAAVAIAALAYSRLADHSAAAEEFGSIVSLSEGRELKAAELGAAARALRSERARLLPDLRAAAGSGAHSDDQQPSDGPA